MPKYTFKCNECKSEEQLFTSVKRVCTPCKKCNGSMERLMPVLSGPAQVKETVDKLLGRKWIDNQQEIIKSRKDDYFWSVEVPRLVQSGTYSVETMLENNWIYYDDKGMMQTRTKPPTRE